MDGPVSPTELLGLQVVENLLRQGPRPIESARAFRRPMDGNGWNDSQLARELAINHSGVSRALSLLDLPAPVQERGELAPSVTCEISKLADAGAQADVAACVVAEGLNRVKTVEAVRGRALRSRGSAKSRGPRPERGRRPLRSARRPARLPSRSGAGSTMRSCVPL
jgi:ParB family chromosome partitioning protein